MLDKLNLSKYTKMILYINVIVYIITLPMQLFVPDVVNGLFVAYPITDSKFNPIQLITHMFMHGGLFHLFFNMLALVFFANFVEKRLKSTKFIIVYLTSGLIAYLSHSIFIGNGVVGASGCLFGMMGAYTILFPDDELSLFFILKLQAKKFFYIIMGFELFVGLLNLIGNDDGIGHFAHFFGGLTGYLLTLYFTRPTFVKGYR